MIILIGIWVWLTVGLLLAVVKSNADPETDGVTLRRIIVCPLWYWLC